MFVGTRLDGPDKRLDENMGNIFVFSLPLSFVQKWKKKFEGENKKYLAKTKGGKVEGGRGRGAKFMDRRGRTRSSEVEGRSTKYLGLLGVRCDEPVVRGMSSRERELRSFSSWLEANEVFLEGGELAHRMEPRARHGAVSSKPRSLRVRLGRKPKARHPKYYMKKTHISSSS